MGLRSIRPGKRVYGSVYIHRDAVGLLDDETDGMLKAALRTAPSSSWNVARLSKASVSLLEYEGFEDAPFPRLLASTRVDLLDQRHSSSDHRASANPYVLHRKEELVRPDHPRRAAWERLTAELEERGLFSDLRRIGRQRQWAALLASAGLGPDGRPT